MIKLLLTYLLLFVAACLSAQRMDKNTVSVAGIELSNAEVTISFTIGEPIIGLIADKESIDQGFWAGSLFVEPMMVEKDLGGIMVYPNPMINELNIHTNDNAVFGITMFAVNGKLTFKRKVDSTQLQHKIDVGHLAKGLYVLRLSIENEKKDKLFKIIKK